MRASRAFWPVRGSRASMRQSVGPQKDPSIKIQKEEKLSANEKLIVALDVETPTKALDLARELRGVAGMFKVGSQLFTTAGPQIVRDIIALDTKVFLDLKFHDIPHQIAGAARSAAELGVSLFTIHASGGADMMRRAVESVEDVAQRGGMRSQ